MTQASFTVLHVCTGNLCRSPMAEALTRAGLAARLPEHAGRFVVRSAGTWGRAGAPIEPYAAAALAGRGIDAAGFSARELVATDVAGADLVLTAAREHRSAAVVLHPRAARYSFTLRELARLVAAVEPDDLPDGDPVERAHALVAAARAQRGLVPPAEPGEDDIGDPYGATAATFVQCCALIEQALRGPLDRIAGQSVPAR